MPCVKIPALVEALNGEIFLTVRLGYFVNRILLPYHV